jgi:hypothetical protein
MKIIKTTNSPQIEFVVDDFMYDKVIAHNWQATFRTGALNLIQSSIKIGDKWIATPIGRFILNIYDSTLEVDHKDRDKLNNQIENLRVLTSAQNIANRGPQRTSKRTSSYKGVAWDKENKCWRATFNYLNVYKSKRFQTEIEAAKWYDEQSFKRHGEFAYQNFPKYVGGGM